MNIFDLIKMYDNTLISSLNNTDKLEIIKRINEYKLALRDYIAINNNLTFGLELEFEYAYIREIEDNLLKGWILKGDESLDDGAEINSPILKDSDKNWKDLDYICNLVLNNAYIGPHCGGHIHIGAHALGASKKSWLNFLRLWATYENIIYRFGYGEYLTGRPTIRDYARPTSEKFWKTANNFENSSCDTKELINSLVYSKTLGVSFFAVSNPSRYSKDNTIEFRSPNGSLNSIIWQNNVNLFINMLLYCKDKTFNNEIINKRHDLNKESFIQDDLESYNEMYMDEAIEFADLVFDKNIDKVYFLKQYLKNGETGYQDMERGKTLTRKI